MVCLRYIIVNNLYKGDNKDGDDDDDDDNNKYKTHSKIFTWIWQETN
jgi:hypothetical protein